MQLVRQLTRIVSCFDSALSDLTAELGGVKPHSAPHTAWQLLEHMRIAQHDILEFSRNPNHKSPTWPEGYWPKTEAPPTQHAWEVSVASFKKEAKEMGDLIMDAIAGSACAGSAQFKSPGPVGLPEENASCQIETRESA